MNYPKQNKAAQFFYKIDLILSRIEIVFLVFTLGIMILFAFLQVVLRNFFTSSIIWGDTFLRHLVLWVGFLGASLAAREDRHINIDVLSRIIRKSWKRWTRFLTNLFSALISGLLAKASYVFICDEKALGTKLFLDIPLWLFISIILIGFIIITFRFLIKAFFPVALSGSLSGGE